MTFLQIFISLVIIRRLEFALVNYFIMKTLEHSVSVYDFIKNCSVFVRNDSTAEFASRLQLLYSVCINKIKFLWEDNDSIFLHLLCRIALLFIFLHRGNFLMFERKVPLVIVEMVILLGPEDLHVTGS